MGHLQNRLLAALPGDVFDAIQPNLKTADLSTGEVLAESGREVRQAYFPQSGIISLVVELSMGDVIVTAMVGHDGVLNAPSSIDGKVSINKSIVQLAGAASVIGVGPFRQIFQRSEAFRSVLMRYEQVLLAHTQQSAACNACHSIECRICRWLLRMRDLVDGDDIRVTHEQLAQMLGVRRSGVSVVAETLQKGGLISYHRGMVRVTDLEGLRQSTCECYDTVKRLYESGEGLAR
jgi:CRP-like cAMP-binding protein